MNPKISIIIPTYKHLNDCLKPCIESIIKYTSLDNLEVIVVANGCEDDGTEDYIKSLPENFKLIPIAEKSGYAKPVNIGITVSKGEYIILLNNDTILLDQPENLWIEMLLDPFKQNANVGMSAPMKSFSESANSEFLIYFCVMISRKVIDAIGLLDEAFISYCEDVDHCIRAKNAGFELVQVPNNSNSFYEKNRMKGGFPIFHEGNVSHKDWKDGEALIKRNNEILRMRYGSTTSPIIKKLISNITVGIPTKNRYDCLDKTLLSIALQTKKPYEVIIVDDSETPKDLRNIPNYLYILKLFDDYKIKWRVLFGKKKGQNHSHQMIQEIAETEFIFRIDDDCIAEPNVLEELNESIEFSNDVGAIAPLVITPPVQERPFNAENKINNIFAPNIQWFKPLFTDEYLIECDHLYSCFLYRKNITNYDLTLSSKAHREETIFTHKIKKEGYKLLVHNRCVVHHFRSATGGIRTDNNVTDYEHDESIFKGYLNLWNVSNNDNKIIVLDNGIGDHFAFKKILPEIKLKYSKVTIAVCYPEVFFDEKDIQLISIADAISIFGNISSFSIYEQMDKWKWKDSIVNAFKKMYLS